MSDVRIMRERQEIIASTSLRLEPAGSHGPEAALVQTTVTGSYPVTASTFYACTPLRIDGAEIEAAAVTFTGDPTRTIMALNLGSKIPPVGTKFIIHSCGGRWAFRYDG
jgi:hypothetical protein